MKIIKIIKFILSSILALGLILCTGVFIFFQTFDTDQYLSPITKKVSLALGRPVFIGHVSLGLSSQGISLDAAPLTIADDTGFTTQPFVEVDRVRISLDLRQLILHREIHIKDILLQSPQIHFIRSLDGNINVRGIGQASRPSGSSSSGAVPGAVKQSYNPKGIPSNIHPVRIRMQDASISYIDQSRSMPLDIWLTNINASLNDLSVSEPFRVSFDASLYRNDPNVNGSALVSLDLSKRSMLISNLSLRTDLSRLDIEGIKGISPGMPDSPVLKNLSGVMQLNVSHLEIGASGDFETNGTVIITGGEIKHFNIIKTALSHTLGVIGSLDGAIDKLGGDNTVIEKADTKFSFHDKTLFIDSSLIKTNIFEFTAKGSVDQGFNMDMETMLHLNSDVSAALVNELDGLKYLMDDSKRIAIGASLKGVIPHLKYKPNKDFRKKSRKALIEEGGNILGALMGGK